MEEFDQSLLVQKLVEFLEKYGDIDPKKINVKCSVYLSFGTIEDRVPFLGYSISFEGYTCDEEEDSVVWFWTEFLHKGEWIYDIYDNSENLNLERAFEILTTKYGKKDLVLYRKNKSRDLEEKVKKLEQQNEKLTKCLEEAYAPGSQNFSDAKEHFEKLIF